MIEPRVGTSKQIAVGMLMYGWRNLHHNQTLRQVVEIALDGVQRSTRYPGGVALRFARVRGYRPDRDPETADTIDTVRALL